MRAVVPLLITLSTALVAHRPLAAGAPPRASIGHTHQAKAKTRKKAPSRTVPNRGAPTSPRNQTPAPRSNPPTPLEPLHIEFDILRTTLPNGLRVVLNANPDLPSATVAVAYSCGHAEESPDHRGVANITHRILASSTFARSGSADPGSLPEVEAFIDRDVSLFVTTVSPGSLSLALWREALRMAPGYAHDASTPTHLERHRAQGLPRPSLPTNDDALSRVEQLAYQGYFPYAHRTQEATPNPDHPSLESVGAFRQQCYAPNNAVVAVSGRFEPAAVATSIRRMFARLQDQKRPRQPTGELPDQINQRVDLERDPAASAEWFVYGWVVPPPTHEHHAAIELAAEILREGYENGIASNSRRLHAFPLGTKLAIALDARRGPSLLTLRVDLPEGEDLDRARNVVNEAIEDLAKHGPTPEELRAAWRSCRLRELQRLEQNRERAMLLATSELLLGDAAAISARLRQLAAPNINEVREAVRVYLTPIRRNLVELRRGPEKAPRESSPRPAERTGSTEHRAATPPPSTRSGPQPAKSPADAVGKRNKK